MPPSNRRGHSRDERRSLEPPKLRASRSTPPAILASVGEVPYDWHIDTDALAWGANAADVLLIRDLAAIATGRAYRAVPRRPRTRRRASTR